MTTPIAPTTLLDPVLLARIGDLALLARTGVDGVMHGLPRARRVGLSLDFAAHRPYQPGDDIRRIDWRGDGRTERFYVKEDEADTNAAVIFALDASASMDFGSGAVTKFAYARFLVASLAWLSQRQGDRVGLVTFAGDLLEVVPPSPRHPQLILHPLGRARAAGAGRLSPMLPRPPRPPRAPPPGRRGHPLGGRGARGAAPPRPGGAPRALPRGAGPAPERPPPP